MHSGICSILIFRRSHNHEIVRRQRKSESLSRRVERHDLTVADYTLVMQRRIVRVERTEAGAPRGRVLVLEYARRHGVRKAERPLTPVLYQSPRTTSKRSPIHTIVCE